MYEAFFAKIFEQLPVMPLAIFHYGGKNLYRFAGKILHYEVDEFGFAVLLHGLLCDVAIGGGYSGVEKTEKIVDLGNSPHRGARVVGGRLLLNGDYGTESINALYLGTTGGANKATCIGRKGIDISALPLGKKYVKYKRTFTTTTQPRDNRKLVTGYVYVYVF